MTPLKLASRMGIKLERACLLKSAHKLRIYLEGEDNPTTQGVKSLIANPSNHLGLWLFIDVETGNEPGSEES
jgi:hypothetical protein